MSYGSVDSDDIFRKWALVVTTTEDRVFHISGLTRLAIYQANTPSTVDAELTALQAGTDEIAQMDRGDQYSDGDRIVIKANRTVFAFGELRSSKVEHTLI